MAHVDAAGRQPLFAHAQAQREAEVEPDGVADDLARKAVAGVGGLGCGCHARHLPVPACPATPRPKLTVPEPLLSPDRIGTDGAAPYPPAIAAARKDGLLARTPAHYVTKHLQQGIESDHFRVKRPMPRVGCFQDFHTARRTIQGFEAMLWLRKG